MRFLLTACLILTFETHAQTEETPQTQEKKRPSWSQGLPERKKAPQFNQQSMDLGQGGTTIDDINSERQTPDIEPLQAEQPKFELEKFEIPDIDIQTTEVSNEAVEEAIVEAQPVRLDSISRRKNRINREKQVNPLHQQYSWNVLQTEPIDIPSHLSKAQNINIKIFVKPNGQVSKVSSADPNVSSTLLKYVSESVMKWRFEAPEKIGITDVVSKDHTIEIQS